MGNSIEGLFANLDQFSPKTMELIRWEYDKQKSIWRNRQSLLRLNADIIHITGDILYLTLFLLQQKVILTIHDIGRYKELQGWKKMIYKYVWLYGPIKAARMVGMVSQFTRNDILKLFPQVKDKIRVIPNGINPSFVPVIKEFNKQQPIILQVGTSVNKNIETVIRAVTNTSSKLVIVGALSPKLQSILDQSIISYEHYVNLDRDALRKEYEKCDIVVFVSVHEGFGMPIVEAQAVGRIVITSRKASIPEIAGNGAVFINDPYDDNELRSAIEKVIVDDGFREALIDEGFKNAAKYKYKDMANAYIKLYEEIGTE